MKKTYIIPQTEAQKVNSAMVIMGASLLNAAPPKGDGGGGSDPLPDMY